MWPDEMTRRVAQTWRFLSCLPSGGSHLESKACCKKTGHCMCESARHAAPLYRLSLKKMESQTSQSDVCATRDISSPARFSPCPLIFTATSLFGSIPIAPRPTFFRSPNSFRDARQVKVA